MTDTVDSASNAQTINNAVRHQYRIPSDDEKTAMVAIKDKGQELINLIDALNTSEELPRDDGALVSLAINREALIAIERVEEAVMWAVKCITK